MNLQNKKIAASLMLFGAAVSAHAATTPIVAGAKYIVTVGAQSTTAGLTAADAVANAIPSPLFSTTWGSVSVTAAAPVAPATTPTIDFSFDSAVFTNCPKSAGGSDTFVTLVQDNDPASATYKKIVRQLIGPCPNTAASVPTPISVTPQTTKSATIQESAAKTNSGATIDPVSNLFMTLFSRSNLSDLELQGVGTILNTALTQVGTATNTGSGFFDYLTAARLLSQAQLDAYRLAVQNKMSTPGVGSYVYYMNLAAACDTGSACDLQNRGNAASALLHILVDSANDPALPPQATDFPRDWVLEAIESMGNIAKPLMATAVTNYNAATNTALNAAAPAISASGKANIDNTIHQAMSKMRADRAIANYTDAMTVLGGSAADTKQFSDAATAFATAMDAAFSAFEKSGNTCVAGSATCTPGQPINPDDPNYANAATAESDQQAAYAAAQTTLDAAISTAYDTFFTAMSASDARISQMIAKMNCKISATVPYCPTASDFKIPNQSPATMATTPYVNIPITRVVLNDWISGIMNKGGGFTYTRDTVAIPAAMTWMGICTVAGVVNPNAWDSISCAAGTPQMQYPDPADPAGVAMITIPAVGAGTWAQARTDFTSPTSWAASFPAAIQSMMGISEDIMIRDFILFDGVYNATTPPTIAQMLAGEKAHADALFGTTPTNGISGAISGTKDGTTAINAAEADAIVQLSQDPNF